ncbi:MAG: hypothetical protein ACQR33_00425 [Candidatus Saccharibacteria bacterium]
MSQPTCTESINAFDTSKLDPALFELLKSYLEAKANHDRAHAEHSQLILVTFADNTAGNRQRATDYVSNELAAAHKTLEVATRTVLKAAFSVHTTSINIKLPKVDLDRLLLVFGFVGDPIDMLENDLGCNGANDDDTDLITAAKTRLSEMMDAVDEGLYTASSMLEDGVDAVLDTVDAGKLRLSGLLTRAAKKLASE